MLNIWKTRRFLAKKLNLPFLTDRHNSLHFPDSKLISLTPYEIQNPTDFEEHTHKLIFLHIPKAAGSSINIILEVAAKYLEKHYLHCNIRKYNPSIKIIDGWQGASPTAMSLEDDVINQADFISGHFIFGIDNIIKTNASYFTVIREPVEREISSLNYIYQNGQFNDNDNIEDYLFNVLDNPQTKMLAGSEYMQNGCNEDILNLAINNLEKKFLLYAPADKTNELLKSLLGIYKLPEISYYQSNITKKKIINNVDDELQGKLIKMHHYDLQLYEIVSQKWDAWMQKHISGTQESKEQLLIDRMYQDTKSYKLIKT